jgi:hypothetical protein
MTWVQQVRLNETSVGGPALAFGNGRLFLAWTEAEGWLNVMSSADAVHWLTPPVGHTLAYQSASAPALAFINGSLFLLWSDFNDHRLNVARSVDGVHWIEQWAFNETSSFAPAMALDEDTPFLCWSQGGDQRLSQMTPRDGDPHHFTDKRTFRYQTGGGPALSEFQHRMYVGWAGTDGQLYAAVLSLGGVSAYGLL